MAKELAAGSDASSLMSSAMIQPLSSPQEIPSGARRTGPAIAIAAGLAAAAVLGGALVLWAHYGTAVFFEMLVSGLEACF
jgi:hypothetical protein